MHRIRPEAVSGFPGQDQILERTSSIETPFPDGERFGLRSSQEVNLCLPDKNAWKMTQRRFSSTITDSAGKKVSAWSVTVIARGCKHDQADKKNIEERYGKIEEGWESKEGCASCRTHALLRTTGRASADPDAG